MCVYSYECYTPPDIVIAYMYVVVVWNKKEKKKKAYNRRENRENGLCVTTRRERWPAGIINIAIDINGQQHKKKKDIHHHYIPHNVFRHYSAAATAGHKWKLAVCKLLWTLQGEYKENKSI